MASELHPWRFKLREIFPSQLPCGDVFEPKLNAQHFFFFWKCFEQSTSWCFGSHFFVARSHRFIAICHVIFWRHFLILFLRKSMGIIFFGQLFTATNCSTLARHALKLICQTTFDSVLFKSLLSHAGQLSCCDVMVHGGHVTETRDFQLQTMQMLEASCLFSFKSVLLHTSWKCQSIKWTACMLNFICIVQSKWYLRLKISVQGPFKAEFHAMQNGL